MMEQVKIVGGCFMDLKETLLIFFLPPITVIFAFRCFVSKTIQFE